MEVLCTQGDSRDEAKHQRSLLRNNIRDGYNSDFCGPLMLVVQLQPSGDKHSSSTFQDSMQ